MVEVSKQSYDLKREYDNLSKLLVTLANNYTMISVYQTEELRETAVQNLLFRSYFLNKAIELGNIEAQKLIGKDMESLEYHYDSCDGFLSTDEEMDQKYSIDEELRIKNFFEYQIKLLRSVFKQE